MDTTTKYVGIDVHQATLVIAVLLGNGSTLMSSILATSREAIVQFLRGLSGRVEVAFEEGSMAQWLHDVIAPVVARVVVCNERGEPRGNKSDAIDAVGLAERLRTNQLRPVFHQIDSVRTLKQLVRGYHALVSDRTRAKLRLKSMFRAEARPTPGTKIFNPKVAELRVHELHDRGAVSRATRLSKQIEMLNEMIDEARAEMVGEAKKQPAFKLLHALPYFGDIRVATLLAILVTPHRFRTKRQLWAFAGLAVVTKSSADHEFVNGVLQRKKRPPMTRGLNQNHNRAIKEVFVGAAHDASCRPGPLKDEFDSMVSRGMRPEMARLTLARKIAAYTLSIWKKGGCFESTKLTNVTTN